MKIYDIAFVGMGASALGTYKLKYHNKDSSIIGIDQNFNNSRNNFFAFWLTDWMKDFDKSEGSKPIIVESPTISTDNFTKIFESKGNLNKPVTEPVDSSIVGVANSVLSKNSNTSAQTNEDNLEKPIIREVSNPINEKRSTFDDLDL